MIDKKAQGMSLKVVIIAVIALIVLVVLILIFTGKSKMFTKGADDTSKDFDAGSKCKIPGTSRDCSYDKDKCEAAGNIYYEGSFSDCYGGGCCSA